MGKQKKQHLTPKGRKKVNPKAYRLRSSGVADKEKFLRGCMAVVGALFLLLFAAMVWNWIFGGK